MQDNHNIDQNKKMKNARSMIIQKGDYYNDRQIRTLVLSTNVNDYDTGEPIVDGSIRKTLTNSGQTNAISNASMCLTQSESDRTVREACLTELVRTQVNPDAAATELLDTASNAVICLSQSESDTTGRDACVTELVRTQVNPDATIGQLVDIISNAVICLAHT
jgi:hypothetical protein